MLTRIKYSLAAVVIFGTGTFMLLHAEEAAPTPNDCKEAWRTSSAAKSCGISQIHDAQASFTIEEGKCRVSVDCSTSTYGLNRNQNFTGTKDEMGKLHNCDGFLTLESC